MEKNRKIIGIIGISILLLIVGIQYFNVLNMGSLVYSDTDYVYSGQSDILTIASSGSDSVTFSSGIDILTMDLDIENSPIDYYINDTEFMMPVDVGVGQTETYYAKKEIGYTPVVSAEKGGTMGIGWKSDAYGEGYAMPYSYYTWGKGISNLQFDDGFLYSTSGQYMKKHDPSDGSVIWTYDEGAPINSMWCDGDYIYIGTNNDVARKIAKSDKSVVLTYTGHTGDVVDAKTDSTGLLYTGSQDKYMKIFDTDGTELWSQSLNGVTPVKTVAIDSVGNYYAIVDRYSSIPLYCELWKYDNTRTYAYDVQSPFFQYVYFFDGEMKFDSSDNMYFNGGAYMYQKFNPETHARLWKVDNFFQDAENGVMGGGHDFDFDSLDNSYMACYGWIPERETSYNGFQSGWNVPVIEKRDGATGNRIWNWIDEDFTTNVYKAAYTVTVDDATDTVYYGEAYAVKNSATSISYICQLSGDNGYTVVVTDMSTHYKIDVTNTGSSLLGDYWIGFDRSEMGVIATDESWHVYCPTTYTVAGQEIIVDDSITTQLTINDNIGSFDIVPDSSTDYEIDYSVDYLEEIIDTTVTDITNGKSYNMTFTPVLPISNGSINGVYSVENADTINNGTLNDGTFTVTNLDLNNEEISIVINVTSSITPVVPSSSGGGGGSSYVPTTDVQDIVQDEVNTITENDMNVISDGIDDEFKFPWWILLLLLIAYAIKKYMDKKKKK